MPRGFSVLVRSSNVASTWWGSFGLNKRRRQITGNQSRNHANFWHFGPPDRTEPRPWFTSGQEPRCPPLSWWSRSRPHFHQLHLWILLLCNFLSQPLWSVCSFVVAYLSPRSLTLCDLFQEGFYKFTGSINWVGKENERKAEDIAAPRYEEEKVYCRYMWDH